jgi:hypothetical protein
VALRGAHRAPGDVISEVIPRRWRSDIAHLVRATFVALRGAHRAPGDVISEVIPEKVALRPAKVVALYSSVGCTYFSVVRVSRCTALNNSCARLQPERPGTTRASHAWEGLRVDERRQTEARTGSGALPSDVSVAAVVGGQPLASPVAFVWQRLSTCRCAR